MCWQTTVRLFVLAVTVVLTTFAEPASAAKLPELSFENFINSRKVIASVYFAAGSHRLDDQSKAALEQVVPQLKKISPDQKVIRIEGFSSREGTELANVKLSMERAVAVELYLRRISGLRYDRYLVGKGVRPASDLSNAKQRRVDIAIYDNVLNVDWDKSEKIVIGGENK